MKWIQNLIDKNRRYQKQNIVNKEKVKFKKTKSQNKSTKVEFDIQTDKKTENEIRKNRKINPLRNRKKMPTSLRSYSEWY